MDVFELRDQVIKDYDDYACSFLTIKDQRIEQLVKEELERGFLWSDPSVAHLQKEKDNQLSLS